MTDFIKLMEDTPASIQLEVGRTLNKVEHSLDDVLSDEPQPDEPYEMGRLEAKLERMRSKLCEKVPVLNRWIGDNYDIKIGIAQTIGTLIPTIAVNLAFALTPATTLPYLGIMAARYLLSIVTMAGVYAGVHYLMNERYRGHAREMFGDALKFTSLDRGLFLPTRLILLSLESVLIGSWGWSRYLVGNIAPLATTFQSFGSNYSGKNLKEGYTMGDALKQGFKDVGSMFWNAIKTPYTLGKKAHDFVFNRGDEPSYPLDLPEEYGADLPSPEEAGSVPLDNPQPR